MSAVIVIVGWYAIGFVIAQCLVARGHSAPLWWPAAAILGAAVAFPAILLVSWRRRTPVAPLVVGEAHSSAEGLHVLELVSRRDEDDTALDRLPLSMSARAGRTSVVGVVGHEAFNDIIETGEHAHMVDQVKWQRPLSTSVDRLVVPDSPTGIDAAVDVVGVPDVIAVPIRRTRRAARRGVALALDLARRHGTAVALLPPVVSSPSPSPSMRMPTTSEEVSA